MKRLFKRGKRRGANAIEFALTFPAFVMLTFGMLEYGWYFTQVARVNGALAVACREGSIVDPVNPPPTVACGGSGDGCIVQRVEDLLQQRMSAAGLACIDCTAAVVGVVPDRAVQCVARVEYQPITGFLPANTVVPTEIGSQLQVRLEWQRVSL